MMRYFQKQSVPVEKARGLSEQELLGKFVIGEFVDTKVPELSQLYAELFEATSRESN